jgi:hypothetical protein
MHIFSFWKVPFYDPEIIEWYKQEGKAPVAVMEGISSRMANLTSTFAGPILVSRMVDIHSQSIYLLTSPRS